MFERWHPGVMATDMGRPPSRPHTSLARRGIIPAPGTQPPPRAAPTQRSGGDVGQQPLPRHCWVLNIDLAPGRAPGLLLEWRHAPDAGWEGRVIIGLLQTGTPVGLEAWVPAGNLRPLTNADS